LGYISTLSGVIATGGMPERRGRKHEKLEPPRAIVCFYEDFDRALKSFLIAGNPVTPGYHLLPGHPWRRLRDFVMVKKIRYF
jgi:hypothetical protein